MCSPILNCYAALQVVSSKFVGSQIQDERAWLIVSICWLHIAQPAISGENLITVTSHTIM